MVKSNTVEVSCQCGAPLARYRKRGNWRLVKMFFERIIADHTGVFLTHPPLPLNQAIACPRCDKRFATVQVVRGKYAAKMNQGAVRTS